MEVAPYLVVLGIDFLRCWGLVLDPTTLDLYVPRSDITTWVRSDITTWGPTFDTAFSAGFGVSDSGTVSPSINFAQVASPDVPEGEDRQECVGELSPFFRIKGCGSKLPLMDDKYVCLDSSRLARVCSVTASSEQERKLLDDFLASVPSELKDIIHQFPILFAPPDSEPPSRTVKHMIYVPLEHVPAARNAYPLSGTKLEAMREQTGELIDKGWIVSSESPWAAPILFVAKDGGKALRMCVDFRDLNALTVRDRFPLPRLDILLHKAVNAKVFSKLDLASGYHQIEVYPSHRELTAFILPEAVKGHALWEWKVMPFGLVNAPATFQRAMSVALRGCEDFTAVYLDDILIFSNNLQQHYQHLQQVFRCLEAQRYPHSIDEVFVCAEGSTVLRTFTVRRWYQSF